MLGDVCGCIEVDLFYWLYKLLQLGILLLTNLHVDLTSSASVRSL